MRKIFLFTLSIAVILLGSTLSQANLNYGITAIDTDPTIITNQVDLEISRPMLVSITNSLQIRERNETLGLGAIYRANLNENVTITYRVVNGLNTSDVRFFADVPGNYSLTNITETLQFTYDETVYENITLPYSGVELINASIAIYTLEFNMSTSIIPFYAYADTNTEDFENSPMNLLTTQQYWSVAAEESFYIQDEEIIINLVANDTNSNDTYGIKYQIDNGDYEYLNFTETTEVGNNETGTINLGTFEPGSTIRYESIAYVNDTKFAYVNGTYLSEIREIARIDYQIVEIGDGTPEINVELFSDHEDSLRVDNVFYSQNKTIFFNFSATVPKGNISSLIFSIDKDNHTIELTVNASISGETMNYTADFITGKTNITLIAITNKGLFANETFTIVIDQTKPILSLDLSSSLSSTIITTNGEVEFVFTFDDLNAGIKLAVIDFGDGISFEVTSLESIEHTYVGFIGTHFFEVVLTVIDWAGNEDFDTYDLVITFDDGITETSSSDFGLLLFFIAIIVILYFLPSIIDFISSKIGK